MKFFYVEAMYDYGLNKFPLIAACYPRYIVLNAKTKKKAIDEAWKIQQERDAQAWDLIEQMKGEGLDWSKAYGLGPQYPNWLYCFDSESGETSYIAGPRVTKIEIKSRKLKGRVFWFRTRPNDRGVYACEVKNGCFFDFNGRPLPSDQIGTLIGSVPDTDECNLLFSCEVNRIAKNFYRKMLKNADAGV